MQKLQGSFLAVEIAILSFYEAVSVGKKEII